MIKRRIFIAASLLIASFLFLLSCKENSKDYSEGSHYSIYLGEFKSKEQIERFKEKLNDKLLDSLREKRIDKNRFVLLYGYYKSSYEAGKAAFNYYLDSLIQDYKITDEGIPTLDEFSNVIFIAKYLERPTVFSFNLVTKQTEIAWSRFGCQVVALNQTRDRKKAFITCVTEPGPQSRFSAVQGIKLYYFKRAEDEDNLLLDIGGGTQLYTYWENPDTLKINHSFVDSTSPQYIVQKIYAFDSEGKPGHVSTRKYNLLRDGYPLIPKRIPSYSSPDKKYQLHSVYTEGKYYLYIKDYDQRSEELVASTSRSINDARWSDDSKYLFVITDNLQLPKSKTEPTGELMVINVKERKLQRTFTGYQFENIMTQGRLLLYDKRINNNSQIAIYDYIKNKNYYNLTMNGGCGLLSFAY